MMAMGRILPLMAMTVSVTTMAELNLLGRVAIDGIKFDHINDGHNNGEGTVNDAKGDVSKTIMRAVTGEGKGVGVVVGGGVPD